MSNPREVNNSYEQTARERKAQALATVLRAEGITAAEVPLEDDEFWGAAEHTAKVKPASQATRDLVVRILREKECPQHQLPANET